MKQLLLNIQNRPIDDRSTTTNSLGLLFVAGMLVATASGVWAHSDAPKETAPANAAPSVDPAKADEFQGTVTNQEDKPVAGAEIWLSLPPEDMRDIMGQGALRKAAVTDEQGKFSFKLPAIGDKVEGINPVYRARLVAKAAGYGLEASTLAGFQLNPARPPRIRINGRDESARLFRNVLKLEPEVNPVKGRLVDLEGRPLPDVSVHVLNTSAPDMEMLTNAFKESSNRLAEGAQRGRFRGSIFGYEWAGLRPPMKTDANGEFTLTGLGRDQMATVTLEGERVSADRFHILGREMEPQRVPQTPFAANGFKEAYVGLKFSLAIEPAVPVTGVVTEFQSGKPIANAVVFTRRLFQSRELNRSDSKERVFVSHIHARTDDQGRYRLLGIPPGQGHVLNVFPPKSDPWLLAEHEFSMEPALQTATVNVQVFRGIWMEGKVADADTGEALRGSVDYLALQKNPHIPQKFGLRDTFELHRFPIDKTGHYRTPGLPGPGLLLVQSFGKTVYPRAMGVEKVDGYNPNRLGVPTTPVGFPASNWNLFQPIDPPADAKSFTQDLLLSAGPVLTGRVIGADGKPASKVEALGEVPQVPFFRPLESDKFSIRNYQPNEPRSLFFKSEDSKFVAHLNLQGEAPQDLTVTLQPAVTVKGRLIETETEEEAVGYSLHCESSKLGRFRADDIVTDKQGGFEIKGLLAGNVYQMDSANKQRFGNQKNKFTIDLTNAKPGDVIDLGDVTGKNAKGQKK